MIKPNLCFFCKHLEGGKSCKAYKTIPDEIFYGLVDHRNNYEGDKGIKWELKPLCVICSFYLGNKSCYAFKEIPDELFYGAKTHDKAFEGDKGTRFKLDLKKLKEFIGDKRELPTQEEIQKFLERLKFVRF